MTRPSLSRLLPAIVAAGLVAACSDSSGPDVDDTVVSVEITPVDPALGIGEQVQLSATGYNADGEPVNGRTVAWSSSAAGVATVSGSGLVAGVSAGSASITATIDGESASVTATVTAPGTNLCDGTAPTTALTVGEFRLIDPPLCVHLPAAGAETYLVGVLSVNSTVSVLTPVTFGAGGVSATTAAASTQPLAAASGSRIAPVQGFGLPPRSAGRTALRVASVSDPAQVRQRAHRKAELALRHRELEEMASRFAAGRRAASSRNVATFSVSALMRDVGDTLDLRYPDPEQNLCTDFVAVRGVVRHVSDNAIFVADIENPDGGYQQSDYESFGSLLDDEIYATDVDYFGQPTDYDANGKVLVLFTQEVNRREGILGMVTSVDLFPRTDCPSSNEGEIYYGRAPDPDGEAGVAYSVEDARLDAPGLIAHELTHIIQFGRRLETPGATSFQQLWELESQATLAEEVVGHDFTGRQPRQNYDFDVAWENCGQGETGYVWYCDKFSDLAVYYGFQSQTARATGAPEQCSWLGREDQGNEGPCLPQRMVYTGWSFLRWLSDHYGPGLGGEQQLHRRLIENTQTGFNTVSNVVGQPIDELLSRWAASLYVDDRYAGMTSLVTLPSWNLFDIEDHLVDTAHLEPYQHAFGTFEQDVSVRAGSNAYFLLSGARAATILRATTQAGSALPPHMRMWMVRVQ